MYISIQILNLSYIPGTMDIQTISKSKMITVTLRFDINQVTYEPKLHKPTGKKRNYFHREHRIRLKDGTTYLAILRSWQPLGTKVSTGTATRPPSGNEEIIQQINLHLHGGKVLTVQVDNGLKTAKRETNYDITPSINHRDGNIYFMTMQPFERFKGDITITYTPTAPKLLQESYNSNFNMWEIWHPSQIISVASPNRVIKLNQARLAGISPDLHQQLVSSPENNHVICDGSTDIELMQLYDILEGSVVTPTIGLLKFAIRYEMEPLVAVCENYLGENIKEEIVYELATLAFQQNNDDLLTKTVQFLFKNRGQHAKHFLEGNPKCAAKMLTLLLQQ